MRTVKEHLESLPHPLSLMAIRNADKSTLKLKKETLSQALSNAFCWDLSPQGHKFWHNVVERITNIEGYLYGGAVNIVMYSAQSDQIPFFMFDYAQQMHKHMEELMEMGTEGAIKSRYFSDIKDEDLLQQEKLVEWGVKALSLTEIKYEI